MSIANAKSYTFILELDFIQGKNLSKLTVYSFSPITFITQICNVFLIETKTDLNFNIVFRFAFSSQPQNQQCRVKDFLST